MRSCISCGTELAPDARFCRSCGAMVHGPEATEQGDGAAVIRDVSTNACPVCDQPNAHGARFCKHCGAAMETPALPGLSGDFSEEADRPRRRIWKATIALAMLIAATGGSFFLWKYVLADSRTKPSAAAVRPAVSPAVAVAAGPFRSVDLFSELSGEEGQWYVAQLNPDINPAEMLAGGRAHCVQNRTGGCAVILVPPGQMFPVGQFRHEENRGAFESRMNDLFKRGVFVGVYGRGGGREELELNCDIYPIPATDRVIKCHHLPAESAAAAAAAASAAAVDAASAASYAAVDAAEQVFYIVADANLRERATAASAFKGRVARGIRVNGSMIIGEDGESSWFSLADGSGFVSAVNLSQSPRPRLVTLLNDRAFRPASDLRLHADPAEDSAVVDTVPRGALLYLSGITANGFAEAKGRKGGVGYFRAAGHDFSR